MNLLIRVPNWLGDAVMAKYALDSLKELYNKPNITLLGRKNILDFYRLDGYGYSFVEDTTKNSRCRLSAAIKLGLSIQSHDIALTFQNSFLSALTLFFTNSPVRVGFGNEFRSFLLTHSLKKNSTNHQAYEYLRLASFEQASVCEKNSLDFSVQSKSIVKKDFLAIAPGAAYGSAKRWSPTRFAELINKNSSTKFVLLGSKEDMDIGAEIERLSKEGNVENKIGKTDMQELFRTLLSASLLVSNDSGLMHLGAALSIPTVAIFGPTDSNKTSIWDSTPNIVVKKNISCQPCKHRVCPKPSHYCMEEIVVSDVQNAIDVLRKKTYN